MITKQVATVIGVAATMRKDAAETIRTLHHLGLKTVIITGDAERTAKAVAKEAGIDDVMAGVLPDGKSDAVAKLQEDGSKVAFVGDWH